MCIFQLIDDFNDRFYFFLRTWNVYAIYIKILIDQETNHIKYERNTPPQVEVENAKISVYVESAHHFNIFFWDSLVDIDQKRAYVRKWTIRSFIAYC